MSLFSYYLITLLVLVFFVLSFKHFRQVLPIKKKTWIILLVIFILALLLRLAIPHYYKLYMDEPRYIEVAKNIVLHNQAQTEKYLGAEAPTFYDPFQPIGWPFLVSLSFRVFGINALVATYLNTILSALTVLVLFVLAYLMFNNERIALYASLLLAINPLHAYWSTSAGVNTPSLFFLIFSLAALLVYCKTEKIWPHLLFAFSFLFSILIRLEYIMALLVIGLIYLLYAKGIIRKLKDKEFWVVWLCVLVFSRVYYTSAMLFINKLKLNVGGEEFVQGSFHLLSVIPNLSRFWDYLFFVFGILAIILALIGLVYLAKKNKKALAIIVAIFVIFSVFYLSYAEFQTRQLMISLLAVGLAAACGIEYLLQNTGLIGNAKLALTVAILLLLMLSIGRNMPQMFEINDSDFIQTQVPDIIEERIPSNCYVTTSRTELASSSADIKAIPAGYFAQNPGIFSSIMKNKGCVFYYEGTYLVQEETDSIRQQYLLKRVIEFKHGNVAYYLYNLSKKD